MDPRSMLASVMSEKGVSFEKIKSKLLAESYDDAESMSSLNDIPKLKAFELIERLKRVKTKNG